MSFPFFRQPDSMDCGPTCLQMIVKYYRKNISLQFLREKSEVGREGVSMLGMSEAAESIGMRTRIVRLGYQALSTEVLIPCILHWDQNHFVVLHKVKLNTTPLQSISHKAWRRHCGVVMQESYIFSDTIARNIAVGEGKIDMDDLWQAIKVANIGSFIENLPLGLNTKIGVDGVGISMGQKQRILIARAVYRNPEFIFFDEATNSLDANNERIIIDNLQRFFRDRTVVVVAHRLSTVKQADQIIVLNKGSIIEQGSHQELVNLNGVYYTLVKNQLELGN